ncbi:ABC transporter permease [Sediminibacillus massiliensis]|uniref:ABC transporter permease n=1 Tax=Sediminibacillus massiliensis TaxID=1926277 RepID=UPI000988431C|nr:ABC transporter permease [Sediminibacillus massiliensis]
MNIINKVTVRHLKQNKRRTLVTLIGVIISVAMITAVSTLGVSFLDLLKRQTIAQEGGWHVQYEDVNDEQVEAIANDSSTEELIVSRELGYAELPSYEHESRPYLYVRQFNEQGLEEFPIDVKEGRLPQKESEVVLSEEAADNSGETFELGDTITLDIGQRWLPGMERPLGQNDPFQTDENNEKETLEVTRTETFTIVGKIERPTWEPAWSPAYTVLGYVSQRLMKDDDTVDALVKLDKVNGSLYSHSEKLAEKLSIESIDYHNDLLRYYGVSDNDNVRRTLFSLAGIIMAVIIIGSVGLIYNAFAISVSERSRHLGMLSSVGATKKQKRNSVFFEGAIIGTISIPIGIIAGLAGIGVTFLFINSYLQAALNVTERLVLVVTPGSILTACLISVLTIFISTYVPARKASKVSAIDAIRQAKDIKLSRKKVKTSKLVRKLFGLEADLGLKNLKRNKRRYQATVLSLVISIVLFLSVSFFTQNLTKSADLSQEDINYDIQVAGGDSVEELEPLTSLKHVTESSIIEQSQLSSWIDESELPPELKENVEQDPSILQDGKYSYYVTLHGLDEQSFRDYAEKVGVDPEEIQAGDTPNGIVIEQISYQDYDSGKIIETNSINTDVGRNIDLHTMDYEGQEGEKVGEVEISALTDQIPMGINTSGLGGLDIVVSEQTFHQIVDEESGNMIENYLYMNSSDPMSTQEALEEAKSSDMYVFNVEQNRQRSEQLIMLISVFTYGFIALISAISIANIFNTISTSISLRKREFAMLKSVGMTPKGFNKMINYESAFYGVKALLYGLPISFVVMLLIHWSLQNTFEYGFTVPWFSIITVVVAIFLIVSLAMLYSISKIKKENIIEGLKQENI